MAGECDDDGDEKAGVVAVDALTLVSGLGFRREKGIVGGGCIRLALRRSQYYLDQYGGVNKLLTLLKNKRTK